MTRRVGWRSAFSLGFVTAAFWLAAGSAHSEGFKPTGGLSWSRYFAASVSLPDGSVLVASENTIERYDPAQGVFFLVAYGPVNHGSGLTATRLADGRILIVGGQYGDVSVATVEIYDPVSNTLSPTGSLSGPRAFHTATLLPDGRVLVAGGHGGNFYNSALASAEIYDPQAGTFSPTGGMASARQDATATSLPDGRVLVAGGYGTDGLAQASAEAYDPATGGFAPTGGMLAGRANHTATALADGSVLIVGGHSAFPGGSLSSTEIFDPIAGTFSAAGDMSSPRGAHTATPLGDGRILVSGGFTAFPFTGQTLASAEIWDPSTGTFTPVAHGMREARGRHVAAALPSGEVLVAGGLGQYGSVLSSAELYSASFVDTEPPVLNVPQDFTVAASAYDPQGTYVYYYSVWATDNSDANPPVTCEPPSGAYFVVGTTLVTCSATDSWGNSASASFRVTVLEPLTMTFTVEAFGSVDRAGVAIVRGTISCSRPGWGTVSGQLEQIVASRATILASFYASVDCQTQAATWSAPATSWIGPFNPGNAVVYGHAGAYDSYSNASADVQRTIQLRRKK
ncbi:MAG TPA: kelch repeat-containing protein [Vicinamibacteria bacterium]|nr:kelch repeat-containing protein [Vicinamibacteria bacterium]